MSDFLYNARNTETTPSTHEAETYHDHLENMINSKFFHTLPPDTQMAFLVCRDVLCWTLGHENPTFAHNIRTWSEMFKEYNGTIDSFLN